MTENLSYRQPGTSTTLSAGRLVSACIGMIDPDLVILGGVVGQSPLMAERVRRMAGTLTSVTEIATTRLGPRGTTEGAARLAADYSLAQLLAEDSQTAVVFPTAVASNS